MISRDDWEESVKMVRQKILDRTHDMEMRRMAAGVMDAAFDLLREDLEVKDFMKKFK